MDYRSNYTSRLLRCIVMLLFLIGTASAGYAQNKYKKSAVIKEIRSNMKGKAYGKVLDNVNNAMRQFPEFATIDPEYYYYSVQANQALALDEEKKMYLNQKADTLKYFNYIYSIFTDGLRCDSLSNIPDEKGRVVNHYHKPIASMFAANIGKLPAGVKFTFLKKDYTRAYNYADMFIQLTSDSTAYQLNAPSATDVSMMSAFAVLSAYAQRNYSRAIQYIDAALSENTRREQLLEIACRCYDQMGDTVRLEECLRDGVDHYATNYFFLSLVKLYNDQRRYTDVLTLTNKMLQIDSRNRDLWFIRGKEEAYLEREDDALQSFTTATEIMMDDAESYSAIGNIYLNMSRRAYEQQQGLSGKPLQNKKTELHNLYLKSKAAFESARQHRPQDTALWLAGLKELYFKLNMGKELKTLENIK